MKITLTIFNKIKTSFKNKQVIILSAGLFLLLHSQQSHAQPDLAKNNTKELTGPANVPGDSLIV
jgi:hypothetical protein